MKEITIKFESEKDYDEFITNVVNPSLQNKSITFNNETNEIIVIDTSTLKIEQID